MAAPTTLQELLDREAIRDCLMRYSRGIDRIDREALESVYWPDAIDEHGMFNGKAPEFVDYCVMRLSEMDQTSHFLGNVLIEMEGPDRAFVETYFDAYHRLSREDGTRYDWITCGRYVDDFEKRDGEWRIAHRKVAWDWFRTYEDSGDWDEGIAGVKLSKSRKPNDPVYQRMRGRAAVAA